MHNVLLIGYGNPDREDDGVSWHVLYQLAGKYNYPIPDHYLDGLYPENRSVDFLTCLQLTPEMAELISKYTSVCFIDTHTEALPDNVMTQPLKPCFQTSPFTHHMTPETCLYLVNSLYHTYPEAILATIRGYSFQFRNQLSPPTQVLALQAIITIDEWIKLRLGDK